MDFKNMHNMLEIFTLEHSILLHNVLTRFSQLPAFLLSDHYETLSWSIFQCILLTSFLFERSNFCL